MKKTLLLLTLCLVCLITNAQKLDTTLLYGRWDLYSMLYEGKTLYRDSLAHSIEEVLTFQKAKEPTRQFTANDSLGVRGSLKALFKTYMTFDKKGRIIMLVAGKGPSTADTGTYEWIADNKIIIRTKKENTVFVIVELTAQKFMIKPEDTDENKDMVMSFTRAK